MKNHFYDNADGGICMNCDRCKYPHCCIQTEECDGHNWDFMNRTPKEWRKWIETNLAARD